MMTPGSRQERWILRAGVLVLIVLIWEGLCRVGLASEFWVSRPFLIAARLRDAALSSTLWFHMGVTVTETVFGFLFGAMAGILAGFALARWRRAHVALDPYLMGVYALPRVALAPLFIMWFGIGIPSKIMLAISIVFFILLINTYVGVQNVDQDLVNRGQDHGRPASLRHAPGGPALLRAVDLLGAQDLDGPRPHRLRGGRDAGRAVRAGLHAGPRLGHLRHHGIFMVLIVLALLAVGTYNLMSRLEKRLLHWRGDTITV